MCVNVYKTAAILRFCCGLCIAYITVFSVNPEHEPHTGVTVRQTDRDLRLNDVFNHESEYDTSDN